MADSRPDAASHHTAIENSSEAGTLAHVQSATQAAVVGANVLRKPPAGKSALVSIDAAKPIVFEFNPLDVPAQRTGDTVVFVFPVGADGKDWNDLHQAAGLNAVRELLLLALDIEPAVRPALGEPVSLEELEAIIDADLPRAPSGEAAEAAAPTEGGGGSSVDPLARVLGRFALVQGDTKVFDLHGKVLMKKSAFELLVTRPVAKRCATTAASRHCTPSSWPVASLETGETGRNPCTIPAMPRWSVSPGSTPKKCASTPSASGSSPAA